jgi:hypothetical protein
MKFHLLDLSLHQVLHGDISLLQELDQCDLSCVPDWLKLCLSIHLNARLCVEKDRVLDLIDYVIFQLSVEQGVVSLVLNDFILGVELGHDQIVTFRQGARLSNNYLVYAGIYLWGVQILNKKTIISHSAN